MSNKRYLLLKYKFLDLFHHWTRYLKYSLVLPIDEIGTEFRARRDVRVGLPSGRDLLRPEPDSSQSPTTKSDHVSPTASDHGTTATTRIVGSRHSSTT